MNKTVITLILGVNLLTMAFLQGGQVWGLVVEGMVSEEERIFSEEERQRLGMELHRAIVSGSLERIKSLIDEGADVDLQDENGGTPLHKALLDFRLRVETSRPLWAIKSVTTAPVVEMLLEADADININRTLPKVKKV